MTENENQEIEDFYDEEQQKMYRFLRKRGLSRDSAEEVLSDSFLVICRNWRKIRDDNPRAYLYRVARNQILSHPTNQLTPLDSSTEPVTRAGEFEQQVVDHDLLQHALITLSDRQREAVLLRHSADLSCADTASIMGVSEGAVKRYVSDGLHSLRCFFKANDEKLGEGEPDGN